MGGSFFCRLSSINLAFEDDWNTRYKVPGWISTLFQITFVFMRSESLQFLKTLLETPSPSGSETRGQRVWLDYVTPYADKTDSDAYGNVVATLNPGGGPRIMLAAHADEIGLTVNYVTDDGYIYVRKLGGTDPIVAKAQRVTIHSPNGPVRGVVGNAAPHLMKLQKDPKVPEMHEIFIDIGAKDKEETLSLVRIGDPITMDGYFEELRNDRAVARAFDNRMGTFVVAEALRLLATELKDQPLEAEICFVSNTMEEVGLFGARQIAYELNPAAAVVVDVTHATDYPGVSKAKHGDVKLGHGPTVTRGVRNHPVVVNRIEQVCKDGSIPLQFEAVSATSGTDADAIFWTRGGIPCALISLPNRYMHSPVEMISLTDLELIPKILAGFALSVKKDDQFKVTI